jgi:UDP-N-acetylmuramate dehydrogenase
VTSPAARKMKLRVESMKKLLRGRLLFGESMAKHTTLGVGGPADAFFIPEDRDDLLAALALCREMEVPVLIIGNGSNILVRDGGMRGVVMCTARLSSLSLIEERPEGRALVTADAGILLSRLLNFCVAKSLTGLEFVTGIPGTVGGAVMMNAGAYGSWIGDFLSWVEAVDAAGSLHRFRRDEIECGYRTCRLPVEGIILGAAFLLTRADDTAILERIKGLLKVRGEKLPFGWSNAGSVFRNPPGDFAGRLIEESGFKGRRIGEAMVSDVHANVIVNLGNAKARDVLALMDEIVRAVRERTGITLEPELCVTGEA